MKELREVKATPSKDIFSFDGGNMIENMKMAEMLANSDLVPTSYKNKPGNVIVAVQMGQEVGLKPMQAIQGIAVINGRPCIWGDALIGLVRNSPLCEYIKETFDDQLMIARCESKRAGSEEPHITTFSLSDAKEAGLTKKQGPWQTYKKRMLTMRARGFNLRDNFADVLKGLSVVEEMQDMHELKQVNDRPAKTEKSSKVDRFINEEPTSQEGVVESTGELIPRPNELLEKIRDSQSVQELASLAVELQACEEVLKPELRAAYSSKNAELQGQN